MNKLVAVAMVFQSRYRAASHFRGKHSSGKQSVGYRFNLVIERLLISGERGFVGAVIGVVVSISLSSGFSFQGVCDGDDCYRLVSISLSSGFSFQVDALTRIAHEDRQSFNLVIERLLISG